MATCARLSKGIHPAAVSVLWRDLIELQPIYAIFRPDWPKVSLPPAVHNCLPHMSRSQYLRGAPAPAWAHARKALNLDHFNLPRPGSPQHASIFQRFAHYAPSVCSLDISTFRESSRWMRIFTLLGGPQRRALLPNLHFLRLRGVNAEQIAALLVLVPPSLSHLQVYNPVRQPTLQEMARMAFVLAEVASRALPLRTFGWAGAAECSLTAHSLVSNGMFARPSVWNAALSHTGLTGNRPRLVIHGGAS